jgi:hypothetical protein
MYFPSAVIPSALIFRFNKYICVHSPLGFLATFDTWIVYRTRLLQLRGYNDNTIIVVIIHPTACARLFRFIHADLDRSSIENQKQSSVAAKNRSPRYII